MYTYIGNIEIQMTLSQARSASGQGQQEENVRALIREPNIRRQLTKIDPANIARELKEYGAWDAEELADAERNQIRLIWIAAGNIREEHANK
jgi:hypothetical protein